MSASLHNKVILITGSTAGLGKEVALQLCSQGSHVIINGRNIERMNRVISEFEKKGYLVTGIPGDVGLSDECKLIVEKTMERFGRIDVLINNAGLGMSGKFEDCTPETLRKIIDTNLMSSIFITRLALPFIRESKGSIILVSSLAGRFGIPFISAYSIAKMGLTAMAQSLRIENAGTGIHVGIVYVGFVIDDAEKTIIGADGKSYPGRPKSKSISQTREKVSRSILRMIKRRKKRMVLSFVGKMLGLLIKISPALVEMIFKSTTKSMKKIYKPKE